MVQKAGVEPAWLPTGPSSRRVCHCATSAWHRCRDSNPNRRFWRPPGYPLPHTYTSIYCADLAQGTGGETRTPRTGGLSPVRLPVPSRQSALAAGVEPASGSFEDCPSIQLSYASHAPMAGLEPATSALEARLSVQLGYIGMVQAARIELAPRGLRDRRSANRATPGWIGDRTRTCILRVRTAPLASPRAPPIRHGRKGSNLHASG